MSSLLLEAEFTGWDNLTQEHKEEQKIKSSNYEIKTEAVNDSYMYAPKAENI